MGCREEHAVNSRLVSARYGRDHKLLAFKVLFHDELALVQVPKEKIVALIFASAQSPLKEARTCATSALKAA